MKLIIGNSLDMDVNMNCLQPYLKVSETVGAINALTKALQHPDCTEVQQDAYSRDQYFKKYRIPLNLMIIQAAMGNVRISDDASKLQEDTDWPATSQASLVRLETALDELVEAEAPYRINWQKSDIEKESWRYHTMILPSMSYLNKRLITGVYDKDGDGSGAINDIIDPTYITLLNDAAKRLERKHIAKQVITLTSAIIATGVVAYRKLTEK